MEINRETLIRADAFDEAARFIEGMEQIGDDWKAVPMDAEFLKQVAGAGLRRMAQMLREGYKGYDFGH